MPRPAPQPASDWLKHLGRPSADRTADVACTRQLVCFPHSGASAGVYRPLRLELPADIQVVGVQYPGRQDRFAEPLITDLHELADRIAEALRAEPAPAPRAFFGHSMGSIVAYEVAQRLGADGPDVLFVSGRAAPSRLRRSTIHLLDDDALVEHLISLGGMARELMDHPEMRDLLLAPIRSDYQAGETYRPRQAAPLNCPLIALGGTADPVTAPDALDAWSAYSTGPFHRELFSGDHFYLRDHWPRIAHLVRAHCAAPSTSRPPTGSTT